MLELMKKENFFKNKKESFCKSQTSQGQGEDNDQQKLMLTPKEKDDDQSINP